MLSIVFVIAGELVQLRRDYVRSIPRAQKELREKEMSGLKVLNVCVCIYCLVTHCML